MAEQYSSTTSTPKRPRKLLAWSWSSLCKDLPEDKKGAAIQALQHEKAEVFVQTARSSQESILKTALGDASELVEIVLKTTERMKLDEQPVLTLEQKIQQNGLPPSSKLKAEEVVQVLSYILQWRDGFMDMKKICLIINDHLWDPEQETCEIKFNAEELQIFPTIFEMIDAGTLYLSTKEASGYPKLGTYLLFVRNGIQKCYPSHQFFVDNQFCINHQYYSDGAIVSAIVDSNSPIYVVEYKPRVPADLMDIEPYHLSELFLQAYYLQQSYDHRILHVLTDLNDFHFFLIATGVNNTTKYVKIEKYFYSKVALHRQEELLEHFKFLSRLIPVATN